MWTKIVAVWDKIPVKYQQWIKGAEAAVATAVIAAFVAAPVSNFHTKEGIAEFAAGVGTAAYAALRLYLTQSPIPVLVKKTEVSVTNSIGEVAVKTTNTTSIVSGGPTLKPTAEVTSGAAK